MKMIEITALSNGAHRNQTFNGTLPEGWAIILGNEELTNFPFGNFEVEQVDGVTYMVDGSWVAGEMPEPEPVPVPEPEVESNVWDELDAAYQKGVNSAYDQ